MVELSVLVQQFEGRCRVSLRGDLDANTAWRFRQDLGTTWGVVEFDCSNLAFVDSSGLAVWLERWHKDGRIVLVNASLQIRRVLRLCGFLEFFELWSEAPGQEPFVRDHLQIPPLAS